METIEKELMRMLMDSAGGILKGVADGVACHHGSLVLLAALAAAMAGLDRSWHCPRAARSSP